MKYQALVEIAIRVTTAVYLSSSCELNWWLVGYSALTHYLTHSLDDDGDGDAADAQIFDLYSLKYLS